MRNKHDDLNLNGTFERIAYFVGTVVRYIEVAIILALVGTLFIIVSVLEALF